MSFRFKVFACFASFLLSPLAVLADGRPFFAMYIEPLDQGYALKTPDRVTPWEAPDLPEGQEWTVQLAATRFHVGNLPDVGKNEAIFQATIKTDTTVRKRLGDQGVVSYSDGFDVRDDRAVGGYTSRLLISDIPVEDSMELTLKIHELDGKARKKYEELGDLLLLIEETPSGGSLISAPAGNIYVQLAMEVFDLVYGQMSENDPILANPFTMEMTPAPGLLPLKPGQWVFMEEARKRAYQLDAPTTDLIFDGQRLTFAEGVTGKKMPTYIILSINLTPAPILPN